MTTKLGYVRPDGPARYRYDHATRQRIGILPATCKRGEHSLSDVGYTAIDQNGRLTVTCKRCVSTTPPRKDNSWVLTTTAPTPDAAELDDQAYVGIDPPYVEKSSGRRTWRPPPSPR